MRIGQTVYVPDLKTYGTIHEISWDKKRIKSVKIIDPITSLPKIIEVIHLVVQAVGLIEDLVAQIISFFRKPGKKDRS